MSTIASIVPFSPGSVTHRALLAPHGRTHLPSWLNSEDSVCAPVAPTGLVASADRRAAPPNAQGSSRAGVAPVRRCPPRRSAARLRRVCRRRRDCAPTDCPCRQSGPATRCVHPLSLARSPCSLVQANGPPPAPVPQLCRHSRHARREAWPTGGDVSGPSPCHSVPRCAEIPEPHTVDRLVGRAAF